MNNTDLETSYSFCRQLSRRAGSSFYAGFALLSRPQRRAMEVVYAFMRHTDDLIDDATSGDENRRLHFSAWRAAVRDALAEKREERGERREERAEPQTAANPPSSIFNPQSLILPALADVVREFKIPHEHFHAVLDGVEMDLDGRRYETFEELEKYCERVASAVGLACIHIWGFRSPAAFEPARQAGLALQWTNILRDVREDAMAGRLYLPAADLRACGFQPEAFLTFVTHPAPLSALPSKNFRRLMEMEIVRAERYYADASSLMEQIEPPGRRMFGLMMTTYGALLHEIARRPEAVLEGRVRVGRMKKLLLLARGIIAPCAR